MMTRSARRTGTLLVIGALIALTGCAEIDRQVQSVLGTPETAAAAPPAPSYCYRTLGKVNCYSQPLPASEANRLVGYQGPPPRSTSGTGPLSP